MRQLRTKLLLGFVIGALFTAAADLQAAQEPPTTGGPATFRRLNEAQYIRSIQDIFGPAIKVPGRFDPPLREEGLMAIGDGKVTVSASGLEQFELRAREIAAQVMANGNKQAVLPCTPQSADAFDRTCAEAFVRKYGRLLYRRPLTEMETNSALDLARAATEQSHSFFKGLEVALSRLLDSPNFIFRVERSEPSTDNPSVRRLDDYSLATRISFLLWDAPPDEELLNAAAKGDLRNAKKLEKQVTRLIASPRFTQGTRSFYSDMFGYEQFEGLSKDQSLYPKFSGEIAKDAQEQTLRTIVDLLVTNKGDYRDLFTTRKTFLNRRLSSVYKVAINEAGVEGWVPYTFGPNEPRGGILTLVAFLMLDPTHEGKTSPTIRGKSLRELFLCQKVPVPPGNVDFSRFQDPQNPKPTVRERLEAHRDNPTCAGCHSITDPVGLGMENYNAIGEHRTMENGAVIDASGKFESKPYNGLVELQKLLRDSPSAPSCAVQRTYEYGVGRQLTASERDWLKYARAEFAGDKYAFPALMRRIATSKAFQTVSVDKVASAN